MSDSSVWGSEDTQLFFSLTPEIILSAVEEFGFRCTGRMLQLNSMENRVYEVEIELPADEEQHRSDRFKIVKFYRPGRWSEAQILDEHQYLMDLVEADIPVIAPLQVAENSLKKVGSSNIFFAVFDKSGGRAVDELLLDDIEQVGRLIARMHIVGANKAAGHRLRLSSEVFGTSNLNYIRDSKLLPLTIETSYLKVTDAIINEAQKSLDSLSTQRIHGDAHLGNLLKGTQGFVFVDFDDMLVGPKVQDLWLVIPGRDDYANQLKDFLLKGYESLTSFDRSELRVVEHLRALRLIHFSAWIGKRWEDPIFKQVFEYYGSEQYWQEQLQHLQEQLRLIQSG